MTGHTEKAILARGCFWGVQDLIRKRPGVISTRVGYTGGDVPNATYRNHGTHAEAIEITFDPDQISYRDLLEFFFQIHDPSTPALIDRHICSVVLAGHDRASAPLVGVKRLGNYGLNNSIGMVPLPHQKGSSHLG